MFSNLFTWVNYLYILEVSATMTVGILVIRNHDKLTNVMKEALINIFWSCTKGYVIFSKYTNKINMYYKLNYTNSDLEEKKVNIINKKVIYSYNWDITSSNVIPSHIYNNSKMILLKWKNYNLRFLSIKDINDNFTLSKVNFLAIELKLNDKETYAIDFKHDNFFMVSNIILDKIFCEYWLYKVYNINLTNNDTYTISFIDQNMFPITISKEQGILINIDDYKIISEEDAWKIKTINSELNHFPAINTEDHEDDEDDEDDDEQFNSARNAIVSPDDENYPVNIIDIDKMSFQKWYGNIMKRIKND
jgi:hypothetical protein